MRLVIHKNYADMALWTAWYIAGRIKQFNPNPEKPFVLGLPTGSTPLGVYREWIRLREKNELSFSSVLTFNMDEYVGLSQEDPQSYHHFMEENLFSKIDIPRENIHILNGMAENPEEECRNYEEAIRAAGGIELFLGGMGEDGHIAFNEPGSSLHSRTRVKTLTMDTRLANARFFQGDMARVPATALTVGVATITDSREILIMASGYHKARALQAAVEGGLNHMWTVSCLQSHPRSIIVCDEEATDELKVGTVRYFKDIEGENLETFRKQQSRN